MPSLKNMNIPDLGNCKIEMAERSPLSLASPSINEHNALTIIGHDLDESTDVPDLPVDDAENEQRNPRPHSSPRHVE